MVAFTFGTPTLTLTQKPTGYAAAAAFGTPTTSLTQKAAGCVVAAAFGTVALCIPAGFGAATAVGTPQISPTIAANGFAASAAFGTVALCIPIGASAAAAFGAPRIKLNISVAGYAVPAALGSVPLIAPAGTAATAAYGTPEIVLSTSAIIISATGFTAASAFGGVPVAAPHSATAASAFGGVPVAVPASVAAAVGVGAAPIISPAGTDATSAFGTPTASSELPATGFASSAAFGNVPLAIPQGLAPSAAFGTPTVQLVVTSVFPVYIGSGAFSTGDGARQATPTIYQNPLSGDLLLLQYAHRNLAAGIASTVSIVPAWSLINITTLNSAREYLFGRFADGSETGTYSLEIIGAGSYTNNAVIHTIRNVTLSSYYESVLGESGGTTTNRQDTKVITTKPNELALNFLFQNNAVSVEAFVGATGGTWLTAYSQSASQDCQLALYASSLTTSITIDGGAYSPSLTSGLWINIGLALKPVEGAPQQNISATGLGVSVAFGTTPIIAPVGYYVTTFVNSPPIVVPQGASATSAFGTPTAAPTQTATGFAASAAFGTTPIAIPQGSSAATAFGTPTVISSATPITITPSGFAASATFGTTPIIVPQGSVLTAAVSTIPIAVPQGLLASAALGTTPITIPRGLAASATLGTTPIVVPQGLSASVTLGTPTSPIIISTSGSAAAFAASGVPIVIPAGSRALAALGTTPTAIPRGFAAVAAFGTPTVTLTAIAGAGAATHGGLALAHRNLDKLVAEWWKLQEIREELKAHKEQLGREKIIAKRAHRDAVVDISDKRDERRLDSLIVRCNRAYATLQEREDKVYAGIRACLVDVGTISSENRKALRAIEETYQALLQADDEEAILVLM